MQSTAKLPEDYVAELEEDRQLIVTTLRQIAFMNLPKGFEEIMNYGMLNYVVPHTIYPNGYHCKPADPLPFFAIASQKNSVNVYHMALYLNNDLYSWFVSEFPKHSKSKLDMGKSCIRFKKKDEIPYDLIAQLLAKISVQDWITMYEKQLKK